MLAPTKTATEVAFPSDDPDAPIGLFDSGVGGLTVLSRIAHCLTKERFLYVADQAHVPYGDRSLEEIEAYAAAITRHLFSAGAKAVVMACNVSSATALAKMQNHFGADRVLGVIEPGARAALRASRSRRIGVLATSGTVRSGAYGRTLRSLDPSAVVVEIPCPRFVPLVEAGRTSGPEAIEACHAYLTPLLAACVDTAILGCTHYPYLLDTLRAVAPALQFVDPAVAAAETLAAMLGAAARVGTTRGRDQLMTTGDPGVFGTQAERLVPGANALFSRLHWRDDDRGCALVSRS